MIRVIDFTESFLLPFSGQAIPGTPMEFAAPELLLNLPADVTENIDIWALGCCICHLLGCSGFFVSLWDSLPLFLADVVGVLGGEKAIPERFRNAFSESGAIARLDYKCRLDWDSRIKLMRGDPEKDDQVVVPLSTEDEKVLGKVLGNALVFEPANRATAAAIVAMMPAAWDTVESSCKDNGYEASNLVPTTLVLGNLEIWELAKPLECENQEDKEAMRHLAREGTVVGITGCA
jgi:serine/threonine protein kinase